jgi:hypothetical protein
VIVLLLLLDRSFMKWSDALLSFLRQHHKHKLEKGRTDSGYSLSKADSGFNEDIDT